MATKETKLIEKICGVFMFCLFFLLTFFICANAKLFFLAFHWFFSMLLDLMTIKAFDV